MVDVINHLYLEKYLYGVVPYEMSNSFPAGALKAQAVAARGYSVARLENARLLTYDISDTSSDQVYKDTTGR
jgi:SpoIID/LytB domain protein